MAPCAAVLPLRSPPSRCPPCSKKKGHAEAVRREVEVLRRLRGCLNVAALEDVFEDDTHVHMVLEYCKGGELHHHIGDTVYSGGQRPRSGASLGVAVQQLAVVVFGMAWVQGGRGLSVHALRGKLSWC